VARALLVGLNTFRTLPDPLSGELCVVGGSLRHRRARKSRHWAKNASQEPTDGFDDGDGPIAGGDASSSDAAAANREPCADLAGGDGEETMRAPMQAANPTAGDAKEKGKSGSARPLPRDAWEFVNEVNQERQIAGVVVGMLEKEVDPRVKQPVVKQLLEMAYPKQGRVAEEERPPKISVNVPR
jgi:hypothetical protein